MPLRWRSNGCSGREMEAPCRLLHCPIMNSAQPEPVTPWRGRAHKVLFNPSAINSFENAFFGTANAIYQA